MFELVQSTDVDRDGLAWVGTLQQQNQTNITIGMSWHCDTQITLSAFLQGLTGGLTTLVPPSSEHWAERVLLPSLSVSSCVCT